jgi:hypothetical protein
LWVGKVGASKAALGLAAKRYRQAATTRQPSIKGLANTLTISYIYIMKSTSKKSKKGHSLREQILKSLMASFKIEGIDIPLSVAEQTLKKVELNLGK